MAEITPAERIRAAWIATLSGNGSRDDALIVWRDLMGITGFYAVAGPKAPEGDLKFLDGQRSVYWAVYRQIEGSEAAKVEQDARALRPAS